MLCALNQHYRKSEVQRNCLITEMSSWCIKELLCNLRAFYQTLMLSRDMNYRSISSSRKQNDNKNISITLQALFKEALFFTILLDQNILLSSFSRMNRQL